MSQRKEEDKGKELIMKINNEQYNEIKQAINNVVERYGKESLIIYHKNFNAPTFYWRIFHKVAFDFMNDDTHAYFENFPRINPYKPEWEMYPEGINDSHWETALKKIFKELGLRQ